MQASKWHFGIRYRDGKILFYTRGIGNPVAKDPPAWAVDIREILAMIFVGVAALCFILQKEYELAMYLLLPLAGYAIGRTVPFPTKELKEMVRELTTKEKAE